MSYQVFGAQKASFLLPFARTLGINPGGIDIANREVAKQLFQNFLVAAGGELPVSHVACQSSSREHKVPSRPLTCPIDLTCSRAVPVPAARAALRQWAPRPLMPSRAMLAASAAEHTSALLRCSSSQAGSWSHQAHLHLQHHAAAQA